MGTSCTSGKGEKLWDGWWRLTGGVDVQIYSQPDPGREGGSRAKQISESQSNGGRRAGGRMQYVGEGRYDPENF